MADMSLTPSASVTKFGSLLIVLLVALVAIWLANNVAAIGRFTAKRTAAA